MDKVAIVTWIDSAITHGEAVTVDEAAGPVILKSCGFVIAEDTESITLALDRRADEDVFRCTLCIPLVCVLHMDYLLNARTQAET